ncbi:MAG: hypothetical protein M9924_03155 [Rhizobiaceae bacterium]|nr:hypothetical protein [Rhizobiaceae bacterium]
MRNALLNMEGVLCSFDPHRIAKEASCKSPSAAHQAWQSSRQGFGFLRPVLKSRKALGFNLRFVENYRMRGNKSRAAR